MERPLGTQRKLDADRKEVKAQIDRLCDAVAMGIIPLDTILQKINSDYIEAFCRALKEKMRDGSSHFGRDYLRLLLEEIVVKEKEIVVRGQYHNLIGAIAKKLDTPERVSSFGVNWLPGTEQTGHWEQRVSLEQTAP